MIQTIEYLYVVCAQYSKSYGNAVNYFVRDLQDKFNEYNQKFLHNLSDPIIIMNVLNPSRPSYFLNFCNLLILIA